MVSRDEVMAALAAIPGPDGRTSLAEFRGGVRRHHS